MRVSSLWLMSNEVGLLSATVYCPWRIDFPLSYHVQEGYGSRRAERKSGDFATNLYDHSLTCLPLPLTSFFAA